MIYGYNITNIILFTRLARGGSQKPAGKAFTHCGGLALPVPSGKASVNLIAPIRVVGMARDRFDRDIHYLRISLTDHCNLRCVYCMPEDMTFRPSSEMLQDDELLLLARLFADLGFDKFRLTGGEPTVRAGVVEIVRSMAAIPGVRSLSMTTNGVLLGKLARPLKEAGLERVNVSLDTLDAQRFKRITRWGSFDQVWAGIQAAEAAGLTPIKINTVVVRGFNEQDVIDLARLTYQHPWQVRFIEMMPFAGATALQRAQVVAAREMMDHIRKHWRHATGQRRPAGWRARLFQHPAHRKGGFHLFGEHSLRASCSRASSPPMASRACDCKKKRSGLVDTPAAAPPWQSCAVILTACGTNPGGTTWPAARCP